MADPDPIDDPDRRRRLHYRAWHRGTREMDFVLGRFVDATLNELNDEQLLELEALIEVPDPDLYAWVTGQTSAPARYDTPLFRRLVAFHREGRGAQPR